MKPLVMPFCTSAFSSSCFLLLCDSLWQRGWSIAFLGKHPHTSSPSVCDLNVPTPYNLNVPVLLTPHVSLYCFICSALCCAKLLQSYPNLCIPLDYSPPDFSVHEILQEGILESVPRPSPRGPSQPRNWTCVSLCLLHWQAGFFFCFF